MCSRQGFVRERRIKIPLTQHREDHISERIGLINEVQILTKSLLTMQCPAPSTHLWCQQHLLVALVWENFIAVLHSVMHSHIPQCTDLPNITILCISVQYGSERCMCDDWSGCTFFCTSFLCNAPLHTMKMDVSEMHTHWDALVFNLLHGWWYIQLGISS